MAFERITQKDWYKILGAKPSDSLAELKQKYQKLALLYHPDKQKADVPAGEVEERVQRFIEIDQAWKILGNEETKKEYDLQQRDEFFEKSSQDSVKKEDFVNKDNKLYSYLHRLINLSDEPASVFLDPTVETMELQNPFTSCCQTNPIDEDNLTKEWPLHAQVYLEDMSWNEDEQCYTLSCRCGGNYTVFKSEIKDVSLVCCDTCSLVIEILQ